MRASRVAIVVCVIAASMLLAGCFDAEALCRKNARMGTWNQQGLYADLVKNRADGPYSLVNNGTQDLFVDGTENGWQVSIKVQRNDDASATVHGSPDQVVTAQEFLAAVAGLIQQRGATPPSVIADQHWNCD